MLTDEDLDLVETDELVAALQRRSDVSVVMLQLEVDDQYDRRMFWWRGDVGEALSLASVAQYRLARHVSRGDPEGRAPGDDADELEEEDED